MVKNVKLWAFQLIKSLRLQRNFDGFRCFRRVGFDLGIESFQDFSVAADEEFVEVPGDVAGKRRGLARERHIKRMAVRSVHFNLVEERKGDEIFAGAEL